MPSAATATLRSEVDAACTGFVPHDMLTSRRATTPAAELVIAPIDCATAPSLSPDAAMRGDWSEWKNARGRACRFHVRRAIDTTPARSLSRIGLPSPWLTEAYPLSVSGVSAI